ncbi:MAG: hypothetical protein H0X45_01035 [Planctomycetes bacterium]|nr:hypothetical protein [Planctomycetota bacterium]
MRHLALVVLTMAVVAADAAVLDDCDSLATLGLPPSGCAVTQVPGRIGQAWQFAWADNSGNVAVITGLRGSAAWDAADGISFWVKGDGSIQLGCLEIIANAAYSKRYAYTFRIDSTAWTQHIVRWADMAPEFANPAMVDPRIDPASSTPPSQIESIRFYKWYYWGTVPAHTYAIDDIQLVDTIAPDTRDLRPVGDPLARVKARLVAGQPVSVVTMGDSLTDVRHQAQASTNTSWPAYLEQRLEFATASDVTITNVAVGGNMTPHGVVLMQRWLPTLPQPDLVIILFGYNDVDGVGNGTTLEMLMKDAVRRVRAATNGASDILLINNIPDKADGDARPYVPAAILAAATAENAGIADTYALFTAQTDAVRETWYYDAVHINSAGQGSVAGVVEAVLLASGSGTTTSGGTTTGGTTTSGTGTTGGTTTGGAATSGGTTGGAGGGSSSSSSGNDVGCGRGGGVAAAIGVGLMLALGLRRNRG